MHIIYVYIHNMYVYVYVYVYVHVQVHVCVYTYIYMCEFQQPSLQVLLPMHVFAGIFPSSEENRARAMLLGELLRFDW